MNAQEALEHFGRTVVEHATDAAGVRAILEASTAMLIASLTEQHEATMATLKKTLDAKLGQP